MSEARALTIVLVVFAAGLASCENTEEYAEFVADDVGALPDCMADQFPFEPAFLSARTRDDRTGIFLQTTLDVKHQTDLAHIVLYDTGSVTTGESIELAKGSDQQARARGKIAFFSTCPDLTETLRLTGSVSFDSFEPETNGVVDGHFTGQARLARSGEVVVDELEGNWRFVVRSGQPYQDFYGLSHGD